MKTKLLAIVFAILCLAIVMPIKASAIEVAEVGSLSELQEALADEKVTGEIKLTQIIKIENDVIINGNNKTITTAESKAFELHTGTVEFNNITIINSANQGRCIDVRDDDVKLTLNNAKLEATSKSHNQPLTIGSKFEQKIPVTIKNSTITSGPDGWGYAIIVFNPVDLKIENSKVTGYAAIYMKASVHPAWGTPTNATGTAGSTVSINKSTIKGVCKNNDEPSNSFAAIVFDDNNIRVDIKSSKLIAEGAIEEIIGEHAQMSVDFKNPNKVTISGSSEITSTKNIVGMTNVNSTVKIGEGVKSNVEIPTKLLDSGMTTKKENNLWIVSEIELEYAGTSSIEGNNNVTVKTENIEQTLNNSLKNDKELLQKVQDSVNRGENVSVEVKVEELKQENINDEEKVLIVKATSENETIHKYFDISVLVKANDAKLGNLNKLTEKIKLSMEISEDLIKEGRKFFILKLHNGKVEKLETVLNGKNLEFETDEFSLYALSYEDAPVNEKDSTPKTGAIDFTTYICIVTIAITLVVITKTKRISKHSK